MQIYLVVIDSTTSSRNVTESYRDGTSNTRNFTLSQGIQNFYFIMAPDAEKAKAMVVATFRAKPAVMRDVQRCISATPLKAITKLLSQRQNTWSYIPIGGVRAPGQQGVNDTMQHLEKMNRIGQEREISHTQWQPPRPITYDAQEVSEDELRNVKMDAKDRAVLNSGPQMPDMLAMAEGGADMEQMQAMMMQMQQMMNAMQGGGQNPQVNEKSSYDSLGAQKADPRYDAELQARIRANASSSLDPAPEYDTGIEDTGIDDSIPVEDQSLPDGEVPEGWDDEMTSIDP